MIDPATTYSVGGLLIVAVGALWKDLVASKKKNEERYLQCENKHNKTQEELLHVTKEVGELKGSTDLARKVITRLDGLSEIGVKIDDLKKAIEDK